MLPGMGQAVGIDDLSVYVPKLFLPLAGEFSTNRGIDPGKLIKGIGIERMAVPDAHEDAASMAAMSLLDLMRRTGICPEEIGKIYVGTESALDEAKAMGTYVIGMLEKIYGKGSFQECSTVEFKAACIGTTFALESLSYWVAAEEEGKVGIVIASDVAKYPLASAGEYTQGAGSVALLVKKNPRLLAFEQIYGSFTRDENDFFRPMGCTTAVVNGKHSNQCYLDAMRGAFDSFAARAKRSGAITPGAGECVTDFIDHLLFHIPYPRMVEYASAAIFRHDWRESRRCKEIEQELGQEPKADEYDDIEKYQASEADYARRFAKSKQFLQAYQAKVGDTATLSRQIGNIYTGSIYLGLASLLEMQKIHAGERLSFGAYGSGCSALFFSAIVQQQAESVPLRGLMQRLEERRQISLQDYEQLHEGKKEKSVLPPRGEFALAGIDHQGYRHYEYIE
ncbi:MAG: nucleoid-structuring protein H-NS [Methanothrix sp.]|jgi:hydroxymethylglutaryl-CoA synthase|nr:nucleoid-structuring protein H-NS [Methanothrix sp.]